MGSKLHVQLVVQSSVLFSISIKVNMIFETESLIFKNIVLLLTGEMKDCLKKHLDKDY